MLSVNAKKEMSREKAVTVVPELRSEAGFVARKGFSVTAGEKKTLDNYLAGAVKLMGGKTKSEAKRIAKEYVGSANRFGIGLESVQLKKEELKKAASEYGLKEKVNYASDADVSGISDTVSLGVGAVAASMLAPIAAADPEKLAITLAAGALAYTAVKAVKVAAAGMSESKTPEQEKKAAGYADVKHAQLALKLLKKEIEAPIKAAEKAKYKEDVAALYAVGYGQPSGGLVGTAVLRNQKGGR